ncbi:hypothetical protein IW261DRAFT_1563409 [Armillaria novae-zelandiae]|uniref:Uncharacterized protein n=1 Tax=Armillaria novae-zelandiae TaxID=153914 RepID=A0AA39PB13_9AGAR|nr:hypothetical protein IW261DRAFT_1563409 [Armillaria novae-zelandiae]
MSNTTLEHSQTQSSSTALPVTLLSMRNIPASASKEDHTLFSEDSASAQCSCRETYTHSGFTTCQSDVNTTPSLFSADSASTNGWGGYQSIIPETPCNQSMQPLFPVEEEGDNGDPSGSDGEPDSPSNHNCNPLLRLHTFQTYPNRCAATHPCIAHLQSSWWEEGTAGQRLEHGPTTQRPPVPQTLDRCSIPTDVHDRLAMSGSVTAVWIEAGLGTNRGHICPCQQVGADATLVTF